MWKKILIGIGVLLVIFLITVALQPSSFRVSRTTTIAAPPAAIFPHVNDFHAWTDWSPWEKLDPNLARTYDGPAAGNGAIYKWNSTNSNVGAGMMTILDSRPNEQVNIKLDFTKPFEGSNTAEFSFKPDGPNTAVTWTMYGPTCFIAKAFGMFVSMDSMMGGEFQKGLSNLKNVVENSKPK